MNRNASVHLRLIRKSEGLLTRPLQYYREDTVLHTLITYGGVKAIVVLGALLALAYSPPSGQLSYGFPFAHWDSLWYVGIARDGYAYNYPFSAMFAPLYPLLIKVFSLNNPAVMRQVAWLLSNAFSFIGLYFLYKLVPLVMDERHRLKVCFAYMVFPVLIVCNLVAYTEPLFLAFTIGAYYFWKQSKYGLAALLAICSVFTRQVGMFIFVIFLVDVLYGYWKREEPACIRKKLPFLGVIGVAIGLLYLFYYYTFGDPFIVLRIQALHPSWRVTFALQHLPENLIGDLAARYITANAYPYENLTPLIIVNALFVIVAALFLLKRDVALSAYSFALLVLFSSSTNLAAYLRYVAAVFPIYFLLGFMLSDDWKKNAIIGVIAIAIAIQNLVIFIRGLWVY